METPWAPRSMMLMLTDATKTVADYADDAVLMKSDAERNTVVGVGPRRTARSR
jgi:hypothetical protein